MKREHSKHRIVTGLGLASAAGIVWLASSAGQAVGNADDPYGNLPAEITLTGVIRDFKELSVPGGHPDFEAVPSGGYGHYVGSVQTMLDADGKPVFTGTSKKVNTQWKDSSGKHIHMSAYNPSLGDSPGSLASGTSNCGITSVDSHAQWFRDNPNINMSMALPITLKRTANTNVYVFDDRYDPAFANLGGFFPINGQLFGNSPGGSKNFHFTYELQTEFIYKPGTGQKFTFRGDDDVYVFINGKLVIDIGGVHSAVEQTVHLDRLDFLNENQKNTLTFFFAERHRTQSNFRIETTITLRNAELPNTSKLYD